MDRTDKLIRTIHPEIRAVDVAKGIFDVVASDETLDAMQEIILAKGWQFTNFAKNAPLLDSHDASSIANLVGRVLDFRVVGGALVERIQWAVDVPGNTLAKLGCDMMAAGYLKALSVGFFPVAWLTPNSGSEWTDILENLGLPTDTDVRCIYTAQEQVELSVCIIGANPNALVRSLQAGIISEVHLEQFPALRAAVRDGLSHTAFPHTVNKSRNIMSKQSFLSKLNVHTSTSGVPTPKAAFDAVEKSRRDGTAQELTHAVAQSRLAVRMERREGPDAIERYLNQPGVREFWNALARWLKGFKIPPEQAAYFKALSGDLRALGIPGSHRKDLGVAPVGQVEAFLVAEGMSEQIFDLLYVYGAYKSLGLRTLAKNYTKFAKATGRPSAVFLTPTMAGNAIPADAAMSGASLLPLANIVASLVPVSYQLVEDAAVDFSRVMVENFTQGLAARIDWACFSGTGAQDTTNGGQTGIFLDGNIATVSAGKGATSIAMLTRPDFINLIGSVNPATLQHGGAFWCHPVFLPALLRLTEANGAYYLLKTPAETGDGTWRLCGFPLNLAAQAPAVDGAPGAPQKVIAFGFGDSYVVDLSEEFIIEASPLSLWNKLQSSYRAWARCYCETREATGLATLATAPV